MSCTATQTAATSESLTVPFVLIEDEAAGAFWHPEPMSQSEARRMVEAINAASNARAVDVEVMLPPAADIGDASELRVPAAQRDTAGDDRATDSLLVRVPFVLIDSAIAGPRWYAAPMSRCEADRMVATIIASGGTARVVDVEVMLPPAADIGDASECLGVNSVQDCAGNYAEVAVA